MQEQRTIKYNKYVVSEDFLLISNYNSVMEFPFFLRAVINTSSKEYLIEKRQSIKALAACFLLSGQRSTLTRAKKSIAAFKLREGSVLGSRTTLRKNELHTVIDKLLIFVLPRLYSEKRNETILEMPSLLFLNKQIKSCLPAHSFAVCNKAELLLQTQQDKALLSGDALHEQSSALLQPLTKQSFVTRTHTASLTQQSCVREQSCVSEAVCVSKTAQSTRLLSQQEKTQLGMYLRFSKAGNNKSTNRDKRKGFNAPIDHLTVGIKDLLLIPELQESSSLFETVRGIDIDVAFSNPKVRVKKSFLPKTFSSIKQSFTAQMFAPQAFTEKVLNDSIHSSKQLEQLNSVKDKRKLFDSISSKSKEILFKEINLNLIKKNIKRNRTFNTSFLPLRTTTSKEVRKVFFLTCFQIPSEYN